MKLLIAAQKQIWTDSVELYFGQKHENGSFFAAQQLIFVEAANGAYSAPCLSLTLTDAQRLIDELWGCGLRPSEGSGSAGSLAATERHLKDMQSITMGLLKKYDVPI